MSDVTVVTGNPCFDQTFTPADRIVKPRNRTPRRLPVVAIAGGKVLTEDGQLLSIDELVDQLVTWGPTLFAIDNAGDFIAGWLDPVFRVRYNKSWQWRASAQERNICNPNGTKIAARVSTTIHYMGWKGGTFHKVIDPVGMYGRKLEEIWPDEWPGQPQWVRMLNWAVALRDYCDKQGIEVKPTLGAIGAQFLTDRQFYPNARRKVPAATNAAVREELPGNHYDLRATAEPGTEFTAHYLDQQRAHHYHARSTPMPHADHLYAYGDFHELKRVSFQHPRPGFMGLYCLDLKCVGIPRFSWIRHTYDYTDRLEYQLEKVFVYSNELPHLLDMGYEVIGIRAAWGGFKRDEGIARYAAWAEKQLDDYGDPPWLKQLLLATYGTLATRPKEHDSVFRIASTGENVLLFTGANRLEGLRVKGRRKLEPRIANVLHRGMIEAGCRSDSVGLAQWLDGLGYNVLSIYADAVMVEADDDKPLPTIPDPWRSKETLTYLQFINQQAFSSSQMTKLPGVSRDLLKYRQRTPGHAPRRTLYTALDGKPIKTNRRI